MVDDRPPRSPRRWSTTRWALGIGLTCTAAVAPALAEAEAHAQLRNHGEGLVVDIDLAGLELHNLARTLPGDRGRVAIDRVHVRPGLDGVHVEVEGLRALGPEPAASGATAPSEAAPPPEVRAPADDPLVSALRRVRGVPIDLVYRGALELELDAGVWLRAEDIRVELPGDGDIHAEAQLALGPSQAAPSWLEASLDFDAHDSAPRELAVHGRLTGASGSALWLSGRGSSDRVELELSCQDSDGHASVVAVHAPARDHTRLHVDAEALPLAALEPMFDDLVARVDALTGERASKLGLDGAHLSGTVELSRHRGRSSARFEAVELGGLALAAELLSSRALELAPLTLDGELGRVRDATRGVRHYASLIVGHRGVQAELSGELDRERLSFDLQLPQTPCQAVLDATPGLSPVLAGTELSGQLPAHFGLDLDFAALARARARYLGDDPAAFDLEHFDAPGELRFELPYLERCTVERLGPALDLAGLAGPYRHDFVDGEGRATRRVLAPGDPGFVSISRVPQLALAFVILEDALFRRHDGFDREQIERAFWFNLLEGRVSRGASTITQQTARTLWLGVDRSLSRKLAEAMLAAELERGLSKRRILELYLNLIELGPGIHGVADAARYHFGKPPEELTLIQALHLASLAPAPVTYSKRFADATIDAAWREHLRRQVHRLQIRHLITAEVAREARRVELELRPR